MKFVASLMFVALFSAGCGDDGGDDTGGDPPVLGCDVLSGFDDYVAGISKTGANGFTFTLVSATPTPPAQGYNTWVVDISGADSAPVSAAGDDLSILPFMPDHGHGANTVPEVTASAEREGRFEITPLDLWMPGVWTVKIALTSGEAKLDEAVFAFCIEG